MMAWLCDGGVYIHPVFNTKQGMVVFFFFLGTWQMLWKTSGDCVFA